MKICVILVDRANYGRMKPVMRSIQNDKDLKMQVLCSGTMALERFGNAIEVVRNDGFTVDSTVFIEIEGSLPTTMAKTVGLGVIEFTSEFTRLNPDIVLIIGDRYEALSASIAAAFLNISVAHIQGGEVSGSIDESTRHAISKFSHLHFPSTKRSADFLCRMGENKHNVHNVGCPVGDFIKSLDLNDNLEIVNSLGVGAIIKTEMPYLLTIFHPVTTSLSQQKIQIESLLDALNEIELPCIWLWPNIDAGSDIISKEIRRFREKKGANWLRLIKNLDPETFQKVLANAACAIGNSSSFIRDSTFTGTPVVLIGERQVGREHGNNLIKSDAKKSHIIKAVQTQLKRGRYSPDGLYGDGTASKQIIYHLKNFVPYSQKRLSYINV